MKRKLKVKFNLIVPCEKEYEIEEKELWDFGKDRFTEIAKSNNCQEIFSDERIYGLKPIENSFYEDSPNREVHSIQSITDDKGNFIYEENK
jgi:hypothetical protein